MANDIWCHDLPVTRLFHKWKVAPLCPSPSLVALTHSLPYHIRTTSSPSLLWPPPMCSFVVAMTLLLFCSVLLTVYCLVGSAWKEVIWGISFSIIPSKVLSKFLQTVRFHSLLVAESHSSVCVCVCVCVSAWACACVHNMNRTDIGIGTQTDFSHYVCNDVYLGIGVDTTHTYVHFFFVPSVGTPYSYWVGSNGQSLVECSKGSQESFP